MKITLKPKSKPVKQRPQRLNPKYKEKVRLELEKMLATGIIELVEESDCRSSKFIIRRVCRIILRSNGTVEVFNNILDNALTKVFNAHRNDWDVHVPMVLWAYRTTCKKLTGQTPFRLVYGIEAMMLMEYIVPSLHIVVFTGMADRRALEERFVQLTELEEDRFLAGFNQEV
eukprot:PITA_01903